MSRQLVQHFLNDLDRLRKLSGSLNEQTIREKSNTYRFAVHKKKVIDLLMLVSVGTLATTQVMKGARRN